MKIQTERLSVQTKGFSDVHDLTPRLRRLVEHSGIDAGTVVVFVPGSTASVTTIEYEPGAIEDLRRAIERLAPQSMQYDHNARWGDGNGFAHVRSALLGPSVSIPVVDGSLALGTWQQVILVDFDNRPRSREVILQCSGE
jgi:secondary thiamine-phosphate synthase enzyme